MKFYASYSLLLLVAGTSMSTVACSGKKSTPPVSADALADSADQIMDGVDFNLTAVGVNRAQLQSDTAYFLNDNSRIELKGVTTLFFTTTGEHNATLTSKRGQYLTNSDLMTARDDVVVITTDGRELRTSELKYDRYSNLISSDSAFVLTEPQRVLRGIGFRSDPALNNLQILRVLSGSAGTVDLPTQ